jgi:hypothetical protein
MYILLVQIIPPDILSFGAHDILSFGAHAMLSLVSIVAGYRLLIVVSICVFEFDLIRTCCPISRV